MSFINCIKYNVSKLLRSKLFRNLLKAQEDMLKVHFYGNSLNSRPAY